MLIGVQVMEVLAGWLLVSLLAGLVLGSFLKWASRVDPPDAQAVGPSVDSTTVTWPRVVATVMAGALALMIAAPALQFSGGTRQPPRLASIGAAPATLPDPAEATSPRPRSRPATPGPSARSRAVTRAVSRAPRAAGRAAHGSTRRSLVARRVPQRQPASAPSPPAPSPPAPSTATVASAPSAPVAVRRGRGKRSERPRPRPDNVRRGEQRLPRRASGLARMRGAGHARAGGAGRGRQR